MRGELADQLLAEVMDWSSDELRDNRARIQNLARAKYNRYQQFSPGMQFVESLAIWLDQFDEPEERKTAYNFILDRLIFISRAEMRHFVSLAYPEKVRPQLVEQVAESEDISPIAVKQIVNSKAYELLRRQCLFLGLSDGAHAAAFRRGNTGRISHEQIVHHYRLNEKKAVDLLGELEEAMEDLDHPSPQDALFNNLFLLDDFTASGKSYFRKERDSYDGKIHRVLEDLQGDTPLSRVVDTNNLSVYALIYVASEYSFDRLERKLAEWSQKEGAGITVKPLVVQKIRREDEVQRSQDGAFYKLIEEYFDDRIVDEHYEKGQTDEPYLGFDQCALPVVLYHNTPNNSVPLLWFPEGGEDDLTGLFPRVDRHQEGWR